MRRIPRPQIVSVLVGFAATFLAAGCTTYRILRYRQPDARNQSMFPARVVRHADSPIHFARAAALRTDLDTVTVRAADGGREPFAQYMIDHSVLAFLVIRRDTIIYERYRGALTDSTIHSSFSVAKSILSILVGIAVGEGKITSLDDPVTSYVPELRNKPAFAGVTVGQLLEMKSGLRYTTTGKGLISDFRSDEAHIYYSANLEKQIAGTERVARPGSTWVYKDTDAELLGLVLRNAIGMSISEYTESHLWRLIGTEHDATWSLDHSDGQEKVSSGFNATARDYARIGKLMLDGGAFGGHQIVPPAWVARSVADDSMRTEPEISTWWKMQHTLYWWHAIQPPGHDFFADGSHGQRIYVDVPSQTIIVQLANDSRQDFPFRKLVAYLDGQSWNYPISIPAALRQAARSFGADSLGPVFARLQQEQAARPEGYVITEHAMLSLGDELTKDASTRAAGIRVLEIVTHEYPNDPQGFVRLSDVYLAIDDRGHATEALRHAAALSPNDPDVLRRLKAFERSGVSPK